MLTPEQQAQRAAGIGASEIGAVCGLNPWSSPHDVWMRKTGRAESFEGNDLTDWGHYMEPAIVALWKKRTGHKVRYANRHQRTVVHPQYSIVVATPDGIVDPDATLEIKTYGFRVAHHWGEPGTDQIPDYYAAQVTWAMAAAGRKQCYVVASHEREIDEYVVPYDPELFGALLEVGQRFWKDHVLADVPPPADHTDRCKAFLQTYYPRPLDKECLPATDEANDLAQRLADAQHKLEAADREVLGLRNAMCEVIGDAYGIHTHLGKALWYGVKGRTVRDEKAIVSLARELGATDAQLEETLKRGSDYRVFRTYFKKD